MSSFAYNTVTSAGMALIARATASHRLIITGSKSCTLAASSNSDLASKALSWYDGKEGIIQSVSANNNVARIVARYTATGSRQACKSICILAKIEGDSDSVILCAISDPDANITLPASTDLAQSLDFPFNVAVTENSYVSTTPGASATLSDLDRFVSMYKNGNAGAGDDQSIRGNKTFIDSACFGNSKKKIYADNDDLVIQQEYTTGGGTIYNPKISFQKYGNLNFGSNVFISYLSNVQYSAALLPGRVEPVENTSTLRIKQLNNAEIDFDPSANLTAGSMSAINEPVVPIGAMVYGIFGNITSDWSLPATITLGQTITVPANGVMLAEYYTTSSTEGWRAATKLVSGQYQTLYLPAGTYKSMCQLSLEENSAFKNTPVLFMRIS